VRRNLGITCNLGFSCAGFEDFGMRLEGENMVVPHGGGDEEVEEEGQVVNETLPFQVQRRFSRRRDSLLGML